MAGFYGVLLMSWEAYGFFSVISQLQFTLFFTLYIGIICVGTFCKSNNLMALFIVSLLLLCDILTAITGVTVLS